MEKILKSIDNCLKLVKIEITTNIVYQIECVDVDLKTMLKSNLTQGDCSLPHTIVQISFNDTIEKKKKKKENTTGIETFRIVLEDKIDTTNTITEERDYNASTINKQTDTQEKISTLVSSNSKYSYNTIDKRLFNKQEDQTMGIKVEELISINEACSIKADEIILINDACCMTEEQTEDNKADEFLSIKKGSSKTEEHVLNNDYNKLKIDSITRDDFQETYKATDKLIDLKPQLEHLPSLLIIKIYNSPIYIYGEYIKLTRNMSQTPLKIKGKLKTEKSISDFGDSFNEFFKGNSYKFMGCGREDIDVKCIEGRPFIIEISNPTINLEATKMDIKFYEGIDIKNCHIASRECKNYVNKEDPNKFYKILIFSEEKINFDKNYHLNQKTPLRVLHRRANLVRKKNIEVLQTESYEENGNYYSVVIKASSGAYIKEFVNGDFNRTLPNLNADLLELDVIKVDLTVDEELFIRPFLLNKQN